MASVASHHFQRCPPLTQEEELQIRPVLVYLLSLFIPATYVSPICRTVRGDRQGREVEKSQSLPLRSHATKFCWKISFGTHFPNLYVPQEKKNEGNGIIHLFTH